MGLVDRPEKKTSASSLFSAKRPFLALQMMIIESRVRNMCQSYDSGFPQSLDKSGILVHKSCNKTLEKGHETVAGLVDWVMVSQGGKECLFFGL